jgi:hypothetical protein
MNLGNLVHELALEGGFSYNITTGEHNPNDGYMVSIQGFEEQYYYEDFESKDLKNFVAKNAIHFAAGNRFIGGWVDDKLVYLDVSVNIKNLEKAIYTGISNNQLAIYDCESNVSITLPSAQKSGTMTQNRDYNITKARQLARAIEDTGVK